jgi:hypothetical protein
VKSIEPIGNGSTEGFSGSLGGLGSGGGGGPPLALQLNFDIAIFDPFGEGVEDALLTVDCTL